MKMKTLSPERWLAATTDPTTNSYIADQCHEAIPIEEVHCSDGEPRPMWWLKKEQFIALVKARRKGLTLDFVPYHQLHRDELAIPLTDEDLDLYAGERVSAAGSTDARPPRPKKEEGRKKDSKVRSSTRKDARGRPVFVNINVHC